MLCLAEVQANVSQWPEMGASSLNQVVFLQDRIDRETTSYNLEGTS